MASIKHFATAAVLALVLLGCDNSDTKSTTVNTDSGSKPKAPGDSMGGLEGLADKASDSVNQAVNSFKTQYGDQVKEYQGKLEQLKQQAFALKDDRLNQIIANAEAKIQEVKNKLESIKPDSKELDAVKADVSKLIADLKTSYDQALARVKELKP